MSTPSPSGYFLWELSKPAAPRLVGKLLKLSNGDVSFQCNASLGGAKPKALIRIDDKE